MGKVYNNFEQVYQDTKGGVFSNEAELRQAFVEALKNELSNSSCHRYIIEYWLVPALEETVRKKRPDIRFSNVVIEVEPPKGGLKKGVQQIKQYMSDLYQEAGERVCVYGLVTDGVDAEILKYNGTSYMLVRYGKMPETVRTLINIFCSTKIPVVRSNDLIRLFGV